MRQAIITYEGGHRQDLNIINLVRTLQSGQVIFSVIKESESAGSVSCEAHRPDEWKTIAIKLAKIIIEADKETSLDLPLSDFQEIERIASVR